LIEELEDKLEEELTSMSKNSDGQSPLFGIPPPGHDGTGPSKHILKLGYTQRAYINCPPEEELENKLEDKPTSTELELLAPPVGIELEDCSSPLPLSLSPEQAEKVETKAKKPAKMERLYAAKVVLWVMVLPRNMLQNIL
jgi:hypothetical protein